MAHPWKAEYLTVTTWCSQEEVYCDHGEASDDEFERLLEYGGTCRFCFVPYAYGCQCFEWDNNCWVGPGRPWTAMYSAYYEDRPQLTPKGVAKQRECHDEHVIEKAGMAERRKRRKARRRWILVKNAVDAKRIAFYWQEQTQRNLCAPGGAGRAADAAAFVEEF